LTGLKSSGKFNQKVKLMGGMMVTRVIESEDSKDRIIKAAVQLFSEKGFDGTRVSDIADLADVNKALIYYYFDGKEDILDILLHQLLNDITAFSMDFIHTHLISMIHDGTLDIKEDRLTFIDKNAVDSFLDSMRDYYRKAVSYALENRQIIRILMLESLKNSKHQNDLYLFLKLLNKNDNNPIYRTILNADRDFNYSEEFILYKFFFSMMPIINFAVYFDDYKNHSDLEEEELINRFLQSCQTTINALVCGNEILMRNDCSIIESR